MLAFYSLPFCDLSVFHTLDTAPSFQILMKGPQSPLAYLCSISCCQAAGEAKKQNLQVPHGECLPLGSPSRHFSSIYGAGAKVVCTPTVYSQTHRCGVVCFSQVLSGAHRAPVWVTAYLGAEAGGMASEGESLQGQPWLGAGCLAFCRINSVSLGFSVTFRKMVCFISSAECPLP